jgi:hypothetical protein|tara:strand:+ start:19558 stop:19872 length:315 start_codon:yes stop_codon:yes gene_type:complete
MTKRAFIYLSMIFLFAFSQIGVAMHSSSHFLHSYEDQQQDQNNTEHQCGQCISISHADDANVTQLFDFMVTSAEYTFIASKHPRVTTALPLVYSARAPPQYLQA